MLLMLAAEKTRGLKRLVQLANELRRRDRRVGDRLDDVIPFDLHRRDRRREALQRVQQFPAGLRCDLVDLRLRFVSSLDDAIVERDASGLRGVAELLHFELAANDRLVKLLARVVTEQRLGEVDAFLARQFADFLADDDR